MTTSETISKRTHKHERQACYPIHIQAKYQINPQICLPYMYI